VIGGGIRSVADAQAVLDAGADKVSVNSSALARPELIGELAEVFGSQCVVIAIDAKGHTHAPASASPPCDAPPGHFGEAEWAVYVNGGRTMVEGREAVAWAREAVERGAGEVLLTSMDRDGTTDGYELELTRAVAEAVGVPVIASGGAGELSHLVDAVVEGGADAVLAASVFHYGTFSVAEAKRAMRAAGIAVRDPGAPH
jgi:cyclase